MSDPRITTEAFHALITETIPLTRDLPLEVGPFGWGIARVTLHADERSVRAGGTVSGPVLMSLVDTALYAAVLTRIGREPMAVTSDLSIRFLRRPEPGVLHADATILRLGRRQAVGDVRILDREGTLVVHATGTYALPDRRDPDRRSPG